MSYSGSKPLPVTFGGTGQSALPAFGAYSNATQSSVTGDGTQVKVAYNATLFDTTSSFNTSTNSYIIPVSGNYYFFASIFMFGLGVGNTQLNAYLNTVVNTWTMLQMNPFASSGGGALTVNFSLVLATTATTTINILLSISNGSKVVSIQGGTIPQATVFGGYLII